MKIFPAFYTSILLVLFTLNQISATGIDTKVNFVAVNTTQDWDKVKQDAAKSSKSIFVDVYTDWCGYCKMMDRDVFNDQEVGSYLNDKFVSVKLDAETEFGESFAMDNSVRGYPTYLFFDNSENKIGEISGYHKKNAFLKQAKSIEQKVTQLPEFESKYKKDKLSREEKAQYALLLKDSNAEKSEEVANALLANLDEKDFLNPDFSDFLTAFAVDVESSFFQFIAENKTSYINKVGAESLESYLGNLYNSLLSEAIMSESENKVKTVADRVLPLYIEDAQELPQAKFVTWKLYYANIADVENYVATVESEFEKLGAGNDDFWYAQAYEIIEEYSSMGDFVEVSIAWIEKSLKINEDYETYALYSYALGLKGDLDQAMEKAKKAKSLARDSEQKDMADELIQMIDSASEGN